MKFKKALDESTKIDILDEIEIDKFISLIKQGNPVLLGSPHRDRKTLEHIIGPILDKNKNVLPKSEIEKRLKEEDILDNPKYKKYREAIDIALQQRTNPEYVKKEEKPPKESKYAFVKDQFGKTRAILKKPAF